ncbi:MAG: hypothetical protein PF501_03470 [Salinisphaera sp.]|nr:hypothetical protein [Salinisphaera sp.]
MSTSTNDIRALKTQSEALATLEPLAERLMARHKAKRRLCGSLAIFCPPTSK